MRYVREGGALMIAAGPEFAGQTSLFRSPLGPILPAQPMAASSTRPTRRASARSGRMHPVTRDLPAATASRLPGASWLRMVSRQCPQRFGRHERASGQAAADAQPRRQGACRAVPLRSRRLWRAAIAMAGHISICCGGWRIGMKEPELEEEALRAVARGQAIEFERQTLGEAPEPLTLTGPRWRKRGACRSSRFATGFSARPRRRQRWGCTRPRPEGSRRSSASAPTIPASSPMSSRQRAPPRHWRIARAVAAGVSDVTRAGA